MNDIMIIYQAVIKIFITFVLIPGIIFIVAGLLYLAYQQKWDKHQTIVFKQHNDNTIYFAVEMDKYYKVSWFENGKEVEVLYPIADVERYLREGFWIPEEVE